jgi:hypothetical protein
MAKRRWLRRALGLGVLTGAAYAVWRAIETNRVQGKSEWEPQPFPFPPQPRTDRSPSPAPASPSGAKGGPVEPVDGVCPATHPVKAKERSRIFHVPGGLSYARTVPDRCYADAATATADGFRAAKR